MTTPAPSRTNLPQTETQILTSFLLSRASLQDIITLPAFTALFPRDKRSHPQIPLLYHHLHQLRTRTTQRVSRNIDTEVQLGTRQRKIELLLQKRKLVSELTGATNPDDAITTTTTTATTLEGEGEEDQEPDIALTLPLSITHALFGASSSTPLPPLHTLQTFLPHLTAATEELDEEILQMEEECRELQEGIESAIGDLSDLRYGKFAVDGVDRGVVEQLRNLSDTCEKVLREREGG